MYNRRIVYLIIPMSIGLLYMFHGSFYHHALYDNKNKRQHGTIIILNGPSAVGKTSIQKAFQEMNSQIFLKMGIDSLFVDPIPQKYLERRDPGLKNIMSSIEGTDDHGKFFHVTVNSEGQKNN